MARARDVVIIGGGVIGCGIAYELARRGVSTDSRGETLRLGPAPYLSDAQLEAAIGELGAAARACTTAAASGP